MAKSGSYTELNQTILAELTISTMWIYHDVKDEFLWDEIADVVIAERANWCS